MNERYPDSEETYKPFTTMVEDLDDPGVTETLTSPFPVAVFGKQKPGWPWLGIGEVVGEATSDECIIYPIIHLKDVNSPNGYVALKGNIECIWKAQRKTVKTLTEIAELMPELITPVALYLEHCHRNQKTD